MVAIKNRKKIGAIKANSIAAEPERERHAGKCADVARTREAASFRRLFTRTRIFIMNCDTGFPIRLLTEVRH